MKYLGHRLLLGYFDEYISFSAGLIAPPGQLEDYSKAIRSIADSELSVYTDIGMEWGHRIHMHQLELNPSNLSELRQGIADMGWGSDEMRSLDKELNDNDSVTVGTLVQYTVNTDNVDLYKMIQDHQSKISGCFKLASGQTPCKVGKWSTPLTFDGTCDEAAIHQPLQPDTEFEPMNPHCVMACDNDNLAIPHEEKYYVVYSCYAPSLMEAYGDLVGLPPTFPKDDSGGGDGGGGGGGGGDGSGSCVIS
jgi:hypothetical protein